MKYSVVVVVFKEKIEEPDVEALRHVWSAIEKIGKQSPQYTGVQSQFLQEIKKNLVQEENVKRVFIVENIYASDASDACKNAAGMYDMMYGEETKGVVPFNAFERIIDPVSTATGRRKRWEKVLWFA